MSRIAVKIDQIVLRGLDPADQHPLVDGLKHELARLLADPASGLGDLPELSVQILELARERGRVTIADAVKVIGASRNTIKDDVTALAGQGLLIRHGAGRGTWYALG